MSYTCRQCGERFSSTHYNYWISFKDEYACDVGVFVFCGGACIEEFKRLNNEKFNPKKSGENHGNTRKYPSRTR